MICAYDKLYVDQVQRSLGNMLDFAVNRSLEYWLGWSLAYYQWQCGDRFKMISEDISI